MRAAFGGGYFVPAILFVAFLVAIFSGFLVHIANLVLGPDPGLPRAKPVVGRTYSVLGLASVVIVLGFWIPGSAVQLDPGRSGYRCECAMRQAMFPVFETLQQKFGAQVQSMHAEREDEVYLLHQ